VCVVPFEYDFSNKYEGVWYEFVHISSYKKGNISPGMSKDGEKKSFLSLPKGILKTSNKIMKVERRKCAKQEYKNL
jgi:hypothetical protein